MLGLTDIQAYSVIALIVLGVLGIAYYLMMRKESFGPFMMKDLMAKAQAREKEAWLALRARNKYNGT